MPSQPLRKYFPGMFGSSIDEADIAPDTILAGDIADGAVGTGELADGALSANVAGRAKIETDYFDVVTVLDLFEAGALTEANVLALFAAGALTETALDAIIADDQFTLSLMNNLMVAGAIADDRLVSSLVKDAGALAVGRFDFSAEGTIASTITIDAGGTPITYLEDDSENFPNGQWTNGGSGAASATSLTAAINGDTRATLRVSAVAQDSTVWVFALAVGLAGNLTLTTSGTEPDVEENMAGGAAAAVKQVAHIEHVVSTEEGTQIEVHIPLPFDAAFFTFEVLDGNGEDQAVTDFGTVTPAAGVVPAFFRLVTNGAVHIAATDIIKLTITD